MNTDPISRSSLKKKIKAFMSGADCLQVILSEPAVIGSDWVSVKDELPENLPENKDKKVIRCMVVLKPPRSMPGRKPLVTIAQRRMVGSPDDPRWYWSQSLSVTHWMPLPEPPEVPHG